MRYLCPRCWVLGLFAIALAAPIAPAHAAEKDKGWSVKTEAVPEKARSDKTPAKLIQLEVWKVKLSPEVDAELIEKASQKLGNRDEAAARVKRLQAKGAVARSLHMMATGLDQEPITISLGLRLPTVAGIQSTSHAVTRTLQFENVGAVLNATSRVDSKSRIRIKLFLEESYLAPSDFEIYSPKEGDAVTAEEVRQEVCKTTVVCQSGGAVVVMTTNRQNSKETSASLLYVAASIIE